MRFRSQLGVRTQLVTVMVALALTCVGATGLLLRQALALRLTDQSRPLLEAGLMAMILAVALALIMGLRVAGPLQRLSEVARRMARGEIETRATAAEIGGPKEMTELAQTLDRFAGAIRRQDELRRSTAADVVHELRGALVGLVGRIEALQNGMCDDPRAVLDRLHTDSWRLNRLVDDVYLLVEAERPSLLVHKRPLALEGLVRDRVLAWEDRFAGRGITLGCQAAPAWIEGDHERIAQVVDNLLSNALRYTDPGGRVSLTLDVRDHDAVIEIGDSGIGIGDDDLARIFDRFCRLPEGRERVTEGTGVGLAVVANLVRAHDGRIDVASRPGQGSVFVVSLPLGSGGGWAGRSRTIPPRTTLGRWSEACAGMSTGSAGQVQSDLG